MVVTLTVALAQWQRWRGGGVGAGKAYALRGRWRGRYVGAKGLLAQT